MKRLKPMALQGLFEKLKAEEFSKFNDFRLHPDGTISFRMHKTPLQFVRLKAALKEENLKAVEDDDKIRGEDRVASLLQQDQHGKRRNDVTIADVLEIYRQQSSSAQADEPEDIALQNFEGAPSKEELKKRLESGIAAITYPQTSFVSEVQALKAKNFNVMHNHAIIDTRTIHELAATGGILIDVNPRIVEIDGKKALRGVIEILKKPPKEAD